MQVAHQNLLLDMALQLCTNQVQYISVAKESAVTFIYYRMLVQSVRSIHIMMLLVMYIFTFIGSSLKLQYSRQLYWTDWIVVQ